MNAKTSPRSPLSPQYLRRIAAQLLPLSKEQHSPLEALSEWRCALTRGSTIVYEEPVTCELCLEESLLTHYLIENVSTSRSLWVGSTCIERPLLAVYAVDGRRLDQGEVSSALRAEAKRVQEEARLLRLVDVIRAGERAETEADPYWGQIERTVLIDSGSLRPLRAAYLLEHLRYVGAELPRAGDLKITLRAYRDQDDLCWLQREYTTTYELVSAHLSPAQRARFA